MYSAKIIRRFLNRINIFKTTAADGKKYNDKRRSLDVIISVRYGVNLIRGTQFRSWANKILKDYKPTNEPH